MAISCVYCGGVHEVASQVRDCWQRHGEPAGTTDPVAAPDDVLAVARAPVAAEDARSPAAAQDARVPAVADPALLAGPDELGRNLLIEVGGAIPPPWAGAPMVRIDRAALTDPDPVVARLEALAHARARAVIELGEDPWDPPQVVEGRAPWEVGPRFTFAIEVLHHLVWSNAVDARRAGAARFAPAEAALAAGAGPVAPGQPGDVTLPDGRVAWIDAGPLRYTAPIDGVDVLTSVAVEHGGLRPPIGNETDADLAPDQLAAVTHPGGAARIIAPAGSGKTRVLTERARHLLRRWNLPTGAVSLVAFNRRAQGEMRERTADLGGLQVRTLNAIALAIVNGTPPFAPQPRRLDTIDEGEVRRILGRLVQLPRRRNADPLAPWLEALTLIRLGLVDPVEAEARYDGDVDGLAEVWPRYRAELARRGVLDFDEQVHRAIELLLTDAGVRAGAQRACRVLLVDEFQDLTPAHLLLVRLLASPGFAVFGVGDDDQTIYGYNGADPAWLIDFAELFPGAGDHPLEVNYRCPPEIVTKVDLMLRRNRRRVPKVIRAAPSQPGDTVQLRSTSSPVDETATAVQSAIAAGSAPGDVAVLTRVNALLAPVQVALRSRGVPVVAAVGAEVCERTAIRAVLAWLRLATEPAGQLGAGDLAEALRRPSRPLHPRIADWVTEQRSIEGLRRLATRVNTEREAERVDAFATDIERVQRMVSQGASTADVVRTVVEGFDLAGSVSTLDLTRRGMNRASQSDDLTALSELSEMHTDPRSFEPWLRGLLAKPSDPAGVVLSTVHRVKGQEWPIVVVHRADADQLPHRLADDVEEERRLFHVALTRAIERVVVVSGPDPSPFVAELERDPADDPEPAAVRAVTGPVTSRRGGARGGTDGDVPLTGVAAALFEALRAMRNELRDGKPAYTVFPDATLRHISQSQPRTLADLARVPGVGPAKLERYGDAVLAVVEEIADSAP